MKTEVLYRFRGLNDVLGDRDEIEKQLIYFADPIDWNDPMEVLRDVIWHGDRVIWRNLFYHYIQCLHWMMDCQLMFGDTITIIPESIPIKGLPKALRYDKWREQHVLVRHEIFEAAK